MIASLAAPRHPQHDLAAIIAARGATAIPLGAYACDEGAHYLFLEPHGARDLAFRFDGTPLPAISATLPAFAWDEREMADDYGVPFDDLPDTRPFREHAGAMPHAVVANGVGLMHFVVGPVHAGIIEPGRFTFSSGGETVVHLDAQLGYAHRGVERRLEGAEPVAAAPLVARICGSCSAARSYAYALALERLAGFMPAPAVDLRRLVACEIERLWNHLGDLAASASGAGWAPGYIAGLGLKELAMRLCAAATGHRLGFDAIVPGGVAPGMLDDPAAIRRELDALAGDVERFTARLFGNASLVSRWLHAGHTPHEVTRAFAAVGPARRAIGDPIDVRAFAPYGAYAAGPPLPVIHPGGDAFARCAVKRDEIAASIALLRDALAHLAELPHGTRTELGTLPRGRATAVVEGPRGAETVAVHIDDAGRIARFHAISASYRTWPLVARAMDENIVPDFPLVNKSFNLCYACVDR